MATHRQLLEAHAFERRRLVTAFLADGSARPGRAVLGGAALGVVLLLGAAAGGAFSGRDAVVAQPPGTTTVPVASP